MQVTFVIASLGVGGAERVISLISSEWIQRGWQVRIVAFDAPEDPLGFHFDERIEIARLNVPSGRGVNLRGIRAMLRRITALRHYLRSNPPDVVLSFLTKINVLTLLATIGLDVPVVISERNNPGAQGGSPLWPFAWIKLARRAAGIVLQTETIRRHYPHAIAQRASVIPNLVEIPPVHRKPHEGRILVSAGRLETQKGFDLLIAAFASIADRHPDWRLVIWGNGSQRGKLQALISQAGMTGRIALPGNSPRPVSWIDQADLFVMSSRYEGFGNVLAEAMLAGLPVVSFDCDYGPRDIIEDGVDGLLVPPLDVAAMAATLSKAMGDPQLRAGLGECAAVSAKRFGRSHIIAHWDELVRNVVSQDSP